MGCQGRRSDREQLIDTYHRLTTAVLRLDDDPDSALETWRRDAAESIARYTQMRSELGRESLVDVARAVAANAELLMLCRHTETL